MAELGETGNRFVVRRVADLLIRATLLFVAMAIVALFLARILIIPSSNGDTARIAHAGGGIEGKTYTNSISALDLNYEKGFRIFEIDFLKTSDNALICGHDWNIFGGSVLSFGEFLKRRSEIEFPPCTLEELVSWFREHRDSQIVSDAKADEDEIVRVLVTRLPDQLVAQAYDFEQICDFEQIGVKHVIITLYRFSPKYAELIAGLQDSCISKKSVRAVTMDASRVYKGHALIAKLFTWLPVYVHTVNDCRYARWLFFQGADEFYTDFLPPGHCPSFWSR